ncbi:5-bromo-4-chloroindolyl phosphate hydrolysis family protein [Solibacillus sp. FSL H8-0538]|uniref:5-bromo-4-chloroindolyl phosphate hydrolysis family protein n=1 Tax=Solibacillus sp. FSL H8-0538 TaxID=2921400 RepID=UPI0030FA47BD
MLNTMNFITRHLINFFVGFAAFIIAGINLAGAAILLAIPISIALYYVSNKLALTIQKGKRSKELGITPSEYSHIEEQIKQAKQLIQSLSQQYIRVRSIRSFKLILEMSKLSKRIVNIVQKNPSKFYAVEDFFYAHLPSAVELTNKYTLLSNEQVTGTEIHLALEDTRKTLKDLHVTMEDDLKSALASDIENLRIELDFAKLSNEKRKERLKIGGEE